MSNKFEWHFIDYPETDIDTGLSDSVICKTSKENLIVCNWHDDKRWTSTETNTVINDVTCWSYIRHVPNTVKPMPLP